MENGTNSFRFQKKERITHPQDFKKVMRSGKKFPLKDLVLFTKENQKQFHRLGIVVSREVGAATYRMRIKRLLREFFRLNKHRIRGAVDIVILVKRGCSISEYEKVSEQLGRLLTS